MNRYLRIMTASAACAVSLIGGAFAQSYSAEPIAFDVAADTDGSEPLLIAAYQPPADASPLFAAQSSGRDAVVTLAGLPTPSIILGRVAPGQEAAYGITTLLPETVQELAFAWDDLDSRNRLRGEDPELFRQLIEQGHIDPPEEVLNAALQTELQRMECYRSGIDGAWGPGSRRSVGSYFDEREDGQSWPDQEPSTELFRTIIMYPDVKCDLPVASATTRSRPAAQRTATTRRPAAAAKPAAPKPARTKPATRTNKPTIKPGGGIGVFR